VCVCVCVSACQAYECHATTIYIYLLVIEQVYLWAVIGARTVRLYSLACVRVCVCVR